MKFLPKEVVAYIAKQLQLQPEMFVEYDWNDRTIKYHRAQVRDFFDFREATTKDAEDMADWLCQQTLFHDHEMEHLKVEVYCRFQELQIEPPPS